MNALVASMAAYVLSRYKFKFGSVIFSTLITGILVPVSALMVPYFTLIRTLGLYDTKLALILTYTAISLPLSVFIIKGFMDSIPGELEEAALLDGCDFYQKFFRVIVPISRTGIVTAATFQFLSSWNEFLYAMLLTSSEQVRTLQMGIRFSPASLQPILPRCSRRLSSASFQALRCTAFFKTRSFPDSRKAPLKAEGFGTSCSKNKESALAAISIMAFGASLLFPQIILLIQ